MRRFRNAKKARQKELTAQFPDLYKLQCIEETPIYNFGAVSIFDHWLDEKEAGELLGEIPIEVQRQRDQTLHAFSEKIASEFEIFNFKFIGKWRRCHPIFRHFTSRSAAYDYLTPASSCSGKYFFRIVIPELDAVFFESFDDTNIFYFKSASSAGLIRSLALECGAHYLE